jgi:hypothetical protein
MQIISQVAKLITVAQGNVNESLGIECFIKC